MAITIRNYAPSDYPLIHSWWTARNEPAPLESMLPVESTFVVATDSVLTLCVTIVLTNVKEYCYLENFAGNPSVPSAQRRAAASELSEFTTNVAKSLGYKRFICMAYKEPIKRRYSELGFTQTSDSVATFCKLL